MQTLSRFNRKKVMLSGIMTSRKAVVAMSVLLPILLGVSALAYTSMTAAGINPSNYDGGFFGNPHCTTTVSAENVGNNAIQTAITAASPGAVICVSSGAYPEQLSISQSLTLAGLGTQHNPTTIAPTSVSSNAVSPDSGNAEAAIILVTGATHVTMTNLVIDGSGASSSIGAPAPNCAPPSFEGVLFLGASGALTNSQVTNLYQSSPLDYGCQSNVGDAVLVQTPSAQTSSVAISNNAVTNYQKNGITCNDAGTTCSIDGNTVSPLAAATGTSGDAANGIQVGFGATGTVTDNTVTGNECNVSVCGPNLITQTQSAGILTYQSGAGTVLKGNTVSGNDIGIVSVSDSATSTNNQIQNNRFEGLLVNDGVYSASNNNVSCDHSSSCLIGIAVLSDGFVSSPTTASLSNNNFNGKFSTALVQVAAITGGSYGGTNVEPATLTINGFAETVTAGSSDSPSLVNITSLQGGQFQH
jgi:parallel beta-helix repeat protein